MTASNEPGTLNARVAGIDHLVYAVPDVERTVDDLEALLGVRAAPGGAHPGRGTRNALLALGASVYLEIVGPDPKQPPPSGPRWFGIDRLERPRLMTWAAKSDDLDGLVRHAQAQDVRLGEIIAGSRRSTDGTMLTWRYTDPVRVLADGIVPFFIDWGTTSHPAASAPQGAVLVNLHAEHPDTKQAQSVLSRLEVTLPLQRGTTPTLIATIVSARGRVELR